MAREIKSAAEKSGLANADSLTISRREAIRGLALATVTSGVGSVSLAQLKPRIDGTEHPKATQSSGDVIRASATSPVAETESGHVRGYSRKGIHVFKGIPYAADTGGDNRFLPAKKPSPWTGVRASLYPSHVCPQPSFTTSSGNEALWLFMWDEGVRKEDCLSLNIWTPGLDNAKRPVMVWLHGGAYTMGSSTESPSYDGENLARNGGVVMVSLNHRLGVFGFLNLAEYGEEYANSAANGLLDIVFGLQWIRDNIANFGGDPNRITIFGQSGGGMKVTVLMAMPPAKGLFHRAIVQSGSLLGAVTPEDSLEMTGKLLKKLEIVGRDLSKLKRVPADQLLDAAMGVNAMRGPIGLPGTVDFRHSALLKSWAPVAGNSAIPEQPFHSNAPECSADVPLIVCTTLNEFTNGVDKPDCFKMTMDELKSKIGVAWPGKVDVILNVYRKSFPESNPFELWSVIAAASARAMALEQCRLKAVHKGAPAYSCRFDWQSPVLDGRAMALHGMDLSFVFDNTSKFENMTGDGPKARLLATRMSRAWIQFAVGGDPNHPDIPTWKRFDPSTNGTMVWDNECSFREHLDDDCMKITSD